jgi:hypothetical protein
VAVEKLAHQEFAEIAIQFFQIPNERVFQQPPLFSLNGLTVSQFLSLDDTALGGADTGFTITDLDIELAGLNNAFDDGTQASSFAQDHLVAPSSSVAMPEPPTLLLAAEGVLAAAIFRKKHLLGRRVEV